MDKKGERELVPSIATSSSRSQPSSRPSSPPLFGPGLSSSELRFYASTPILRPNDEVSVLVLGNMLDALGKASVQGIAVDVLEVLELPVLSRSGLVFSHLPLLVLSR